MEKNLTEKKPIISKTKVKFSQNNLIYDLSKIIKSQKMSTQRILKKESNSKIINNNNNSLTDSSQKKKSKRQQKMLPRGTILNLKKTIPQTHHNCLINLIKKKQLSCTQEGIDKITNKIIYNLKNFSSNKKEKNDSSKCSDSENDEHNTRFFIPNITTVKKKSNFFYDFKNKKIKSRNTGNNLSMKLTFEKTKSRLVLFPKAKKECKIIPYENKKNKKMITKTKTAKKSEENKENYSNNYNCKDNNKIPNSNDIILNKIKQQKKTRNYKKKIESDLYQFDDIINSIDDEHKINDISININNMNSKTFEYTNLINSKSDKQESQIIKNINISFVGKETVKETTTNNNTTIINSNSDYISEKKINDSPENVTDREEDKFTLPIHKINHHINEERKRYKKFERKSEHNFSINNLNNIDEDCNCNEHIRNIPFVNINKSSKNDFPSYKNNLNKFKNLTAGRKPPISLVISPNQRNNLFKAINVNNKRNKDTNLILYNLLINKENNDIKKLIKKYLDKKSLLKLSSLNKIFYKNYRIFLYKYLYNKSLASNKSIQEKNAYIMKIINSTFQYSSNNLNNTKELKDTYNKYKFKSKYDIEIIRDLTRTYPNDNSFSKDSKNYKKLYNILTCYSNYNKSIGYTQGLNFIGANIIYIFESEEKSFLFLDSLINRFELDNYFGIDNKNLITKLMFYSNVLNKYIPDIISFFNKQNINHDFFSTGWILTLFSNSMKKECLVTSWAFMIIFGWKFFYSFVIQILIWYKKDIFNSNLNELCYKMKGILSDDKFHLNYNSIIKNTFIFMLNNIIL